MCVNASPLRARAMAQAVSHRPLIAEARVS
jgi:hypothetical protein